MIIIIYIFICCSQELVFLNFQRASSYKVLHTSTLTADTSRRLGWRSPHHQSVSSAPKNDIKLADLPQLARRKLEIDPRLAISSPYLIMLTDILLNGART